MKKFKIQSLLIFSLIATGGVAEAGKGRSGADPRALEFLGAAGYFCQWLSNHSISTVSEADCNIEVKDIEESLNDSARTARIEFLDKGVKDSNYVSKDIIFEHLERRLVGSIERWDGLSVSQRMVAAAMEMTLLLNIPNRYSVGLKYRETSLFGDLNPKIPMQFLPIGTRFVAINPIVFPAFATALGFSESYLFPTNLVSYNDSYTASQSFNVVGSRRRGCFFFPGHKSDFNRNLTEFTLTAQSLGGALNYQVTTPRSDSEKSRLMFSCWSVKPDSYYSWGWIKPSEPDEFSIADLLIAIGNRFHVILPKTTSDI